MERELKVSATESKSLDQRNEYNMQARIPKNPCGTNTKKQKQANKKGKEVLWENIRKDEEIPECEGQLISDKINCLW